MPGKEYYKEKLLQNIKHIQKYCPDFTMTEQQIDAFLSDEKIRVHEKYQNFETTSSFASDMGSDKKNYRANIVKKYVPTGTMPESFFRNYYHMVREEKTPEDIEFNKKIFTNLTRDDELGETARENYIVECLNTPLKIDYKKFDPNTPIEELADYAAENYDIGGIAMENDHFVTQNTLIKVKDKTKFANIKKLGETVGAYLRDLPLLIKDEAFLTLPLEYLNDEQFNKLLKNIGDIKNGGLTKDTGYPYLNKILPLEQLRRDTPKVVEEFKALNQKPFTFDDFEYTVPKNQRLTGGFIPRKEAVLQGIDMLLNTDYPAPSQQLDDMKNELNYVKKLLAEEKYLQGQEEMEAFAADVKKATLAMHKFRRLPENADLYKKISSVMLLMSPFTKAEALNDYITYYKADLAANSLTNDKLKSLNETMESLRFVDEYGEKETLTELDIYDLRNQMAEIINDARSLSDNPASTLSTRAMMSDIQKKVTKQLKAMNKAVPGMTLDDALAGSSRELDMTGHVFKTVGNTMSSRMMMTITGDDGSRQNGFFTQKTEFDINKEIERVQDLLKKKYPGQEALAEEYTRAYYMEDFKKVNEFREQHPEANELFSDCEYESSEYGEKVFGVQMMGFDNKKQVVRTDLRNVAMSEVAALLGQDDLIAKSTTMTLYDDGKPIEGIFMNTAPGADIANIDKHSPFLNVTANCLDNSPALKQIADMQVLDYICGNTDRHEGNLMYQFDQNGKIVSVMGIDNDTSFPNMGELSNSKFTRIEGMKYISASMAEKVKNLTPEMLKTALSGNAIEPECEEYTIKRLNELKAAINDNKITIMADEDFEKHSLQDFVPDNGSTSTFGQIQTKIKNVINMSPKERQEILNAPDKEKKEDLLDMFKSIDKKQIAQDIQPVEEKLELLEEAELNVHFGSTEFENVKKALRQINDANRLISESPNLASKNSLEKMQKAYDQVVKYCDKYLERKRKQGKEDLTTGKTGKRILAIKEVKEFCKNKTASIEKTLNPFNIDKDLITAKQERDRGMIEGLDPKLAGDIVKEMNTLSADKESSSRDRIYAAEQIKVVMKYMKEKGVNPKDCGLQKADLQEAQKTIMTGRAAYAKEHPEAKQKAQTLSEPQKEVQNQNVL